MQKSALQYGEIIFQSKVIPLFLPKFSKLHSFYIMVYCIPYMEVTVDLFTLYGSDCREEKKKAKHGKMRLWGLRG